MKNMFNVTTILPHNLLQTNPLEARKCSAAQGPHSEVVPCAFWRLVLKSCDECKGSFVRGCEAKWWSHWTCSSLGTIFQPMWINSVPDVKYCCNNKNVLCAQSMVWHFVRHSVYICESLHFLSCYLQVSRWTGRTETCSFCMVHIYIVVLGVDLTDYLLIVESTTGWHPSILK